MPTHTVLASNFLVPNGTFIAELIAFVIILAVLWRYVLPPVSNAMKERQNLIQSQLEEGKRAAERLKQAEADYQKAIDQARKTATTIRDEARADAASIREKMLAQAVEERDRIVESGRELLATERQEVMRTLRTDLGDLAIELASRILGESLADEGRQRGTVDRFLAQLEDSEPIVRR